MVVFTQRRTRNPLPPWCGYAIMRGPASKGVFMSVGVTRNHLELAERIVRRAHRAGGLAPLDLDRFWADQDKALADPWAADCPQLPLGMRMSVEAIFAELGIPEDWHRLHHDPQWRSERSRDYNDVSERIVGRRVLDESPPPPPDHVWPEVKTLPDIFEARQEWHTWSYWIHPAARDEDDLAALLDRVEWRLEDLREFLLPPNWSSEKARLNALGLQSPIYRDQRGPVTFATSLYGTEKLIFLLIDAPDLADRLRDLICSAVLGRARILDEERGWTLDRAARGWYWRDDNCCLLNEELYDRFGKPILKAVYDRYAPDPGDMRAQHSDSDMAQHLPTFAELGMNDVNFGPSLTIAQIREAMPNALIRGQLAPFTLSRNHEAAIVAETLRDIEMARPTKGMIYETAGSINNGSRLSAMRLIMATIQEYGRYDREPLGLADAAARDIV